MPRQAAFEELLARHEELTRRFAQLLHDDAGQVLTSIALQLSVLEGAAAEDVRVLQETLEDLLERFRQAQAELGGAVVEKRGLLAGLSQMARTSRSLEVYGSVAPSWPVKANQAAFRIIEALQPKRVTVNRDSVDADGNISPYAAAVAEAAGLTLSPGVQANTIRIKHGNQGVNR
ncbi:histidine kinase [Bryobacter aggregatus]|uniref:histidine kinase n=1 Tax=Bryobacter aggregatus TaxID=360054 RepID=UPI0004E10648|nr:histidine kinase [Bryobacter aggregatus]